MPKRNFECLLLLALIAASGLALAGRPRQVQRAAYWDRSLPLTVQGLAPGLSRAQIQAKGPGAAGRVLFIGDIAGAVYGDTLRQGDQVLLVLGDAERRVREVLGEPEFRGKNWPSGDGTLCAGEHYWKYGGRIFVELKNDRVCGLCLGT